MAVVWSWILSFASTASAMLGLERISFLTIPVFGAWICGVLGGERLRNGVAIPRYPNDACN